MGPIIGVVIKEPLSAAKALDIIKSERISFLACPLIRPAFASGANEINAEILPYDYSFHKISSQDFSSKIVGIMQPFTNPKSVIKELEWSAYLGTRAVVLHPPKAHLQNLSPNSQVDSSTFVEFSSSVRKIFDLSPASSVWIQLSVLDNLDIWRSLHMFCGPFASITVILSFLDINSSTTDTLEYLCNYWKDNLATKFQPIPTSAILIPASSLRRDDSGKLTFGPLDAVIQHYVDSNTNILLSDTNSQNILSNRCLLNDLLTTLQSFEVNKEISANWDYWDLPQYPLQPLRDNLQNQCYENFESSLSKYHAYQLAIKNYLADTVAKGCTKIVFLVAGCGRGPLIQSIIDAQVQMLGNFTHFVIAIDKNPHSLFRVKSKAIDANWDKVIAFECDMRDSSFVKKIKPFLDGQECELCIVSELLGSSGDNELAPECLGGLSNLLHSGLMADKIKITFIPYNCINFWEPIYAPKLYQNLQRMAITNPTIMDSPSVSCFNCIFRPCEIKAGFKFDFTSKAPDDYSRFVTIEFEAYYTSEINGIAGYFLSSLYENHFISTLPGKYLHESRDISWFPLFLPLHSPITVRKGEKITIHLWRKQNSARVWYEWAVANPLLSQLSNADGRCWCISKLI